MHQPINTPVIIAGAGPAGCSASFFLSKAGINHIILEKASFPRDKVCGDACSGKTATVIKQANPEWLSEIYNHPQTFLPSYGLTFIAPNGKVLEIPFKHDRKPDDKASGFTLPRLVFDDFLFKKIDKKYATVHENTNIQTVERKGGAVQVTALVDNESVTFNAPIIIGADGDKSIVRKTFHNSNNNSKTDAIGLRAYYKNVTGFNEDKFIELHFLPEMLPGYFWIFPLPDGMANVGMGILSEVVRKKKINLRETMLATIEKNPSIKERFKDAQLVDKIQGWGLPMSFSRQPVSGEDYMLVGDAASLIDPFSGEGIGNALYSGMLAATAIEGCIKDSSYDASTIKKNYDDVLYKKIGDELNISKTLQKLSSKPWLFNMVVNKAYKSPMLKKTISCMFSDLDMRRQMQNPLFYLKVLLNR